MRYLYWNFNYGKGQLVYIGLIRQNFVLPERHRDWNSSHKLVASVSSSRAHELSNYMSLDFETLKKHRGVGDASQDSVLVCWFLSIILLLSPSLIARNCKGRRASSVILVKLWEVASLMWPGEIYRVIFQVRGSQPWGQQRWWHSTFEPSLQFAHSPWIQLLRRLLMIFIGTTDEFRNRYCH
jgi:hypothetical protein